MAQTFFSFFSIENMQKKFSHSSFLFFFSLKRKGNAKCRNKIKPNEGTKRSQIGEQKCAKWGISLVIGLKKRKQKWELSSQIKCFEFHGNSVPTSAKQKSHGISPTATHLPFISHEFGNSVPTHYPFCLNTSSK